MTPVQDGPLTGVRVVEFEGIGPGPHCAMMMSDLGADVLRIARPGSTAPLLPIVDRGRAVIQLDLGSEAGRNAALAALDLADVLIEGFRPGVMERLGLGPEEVAQRNPGLIYGRITGWGQEGPLSGAAGHDINYIAVTGALAAMGRPGEPSMPPLNLVGDYGGGSMFLALGIVAALFERARSGKGQVIDAAIVDGTTSLMTLFAGLQPGNLISMDRSCNFLGGAAPYYRCYFCEDGEQIAVGAIEPQFYRELLDRIGAPAQICDERFDVEKWPQHAATLAAIFLSRPTSHWRTVLEGTDACAVVVVPLSQAPDHPHLAARGLFVEHDGLRQVGVVPRFSRTPGAIQPSTSAEAMLAKWASEPLRTQEPRPSGGSTQRDDG